MITEFIEANLARIEATAREATPGPWSVFNMADGSYDTGDGGGWWWVWREGVEHYAGIAEINSVDDFDGPPPSQPIAGAAITDGSRGEVERRDAAHIALHDPAHVLAWVAAIRAVVEIHRPNICPNPEHPHDATCDECLDEWPCPTSRAIAGIFQDQPGYDEEWR